MPLLSMQRCVKTYSRSRHKDDSAIKAFDSICKEDSLPFNLVTESQLSCFAHGDTVRQNLRKRKSEEEDKDEGKSLSSDDLQLFSSDEDQFLAAISKKKTDQKDNVKCKDTAQKPARVTRNRSARISLHNQSTRRTKASDKDGILSHPMAIGDVKQQAVDKLNSLYGEKLILRQENLKGTVSEQKPSAVKEVTEKLEYGKNVKKSVLKKGVSSKAKSIDDDEVLMLGKQIDCVKTGTVESLEEDRTSQETSGKTQSLECKNETQENFRRTRSFVGVKMMQADYRIDGEASHKSTKAENGTHRKSRLQLKLKQNSLTQSNDSKVESEFSIQDMLTEQKICENSKSRHHIDQGKSEVLNKCSSDNNRPANVLLTSVAVPGNKAMDQILETVVLHKQCSEPKSEAVKQSFSQQELDCSMKQKVQAQAFVDKFSQLFASRKGTANKLRLSRASSNALPANTNGHSEKKLTPIKTTVLSAEGSSPKSPGDLIQIEKCVTTPCDSYDLTTFSETLVMENNSSRQSTSWHFQRADFLPVYEEHKYFRCLEDEEEVTSDHNYSLLSSPETSKPVADPYTVDVAADRSKVDTLNNNKTFEDRSLSLKTYSKKCTDNFYNKQSSETPQLNEMFEQDDCSVLLLSPLPESPLPSASQQSPPPVVSGKSATPVHSYNTRIRSGVKRVVMSRLKSSSYRRPKDRKTKNVNETDIDMRERNLRNGDEIIQEKSETVSKTKKSCSSLRRRLIDSEKADDICELSSRDDDDSAVAETRHTMLNSKPNADIVELQFSKDWTSGRESNSLIRSTVEDSMKRLRLEDPHKSEIGKNRDSTEIKNKWTTNIVKPDNLEVEEHGKRFEESCVSTKAALSLCRKSSENSLLKTKSEMSYVEKETKSETNCKLASKSCNITSSDNRSKGFPSARTGRRLLKSPSQHSSKTKAVYNPRQWHDSSEDEVLGKPSKCQLSRAKSNKLEYHSKASLDDPSSVLKRVSSQPQKPHENDVIKVQVPREYKPLFTVVHNVKQAHECQEHGETQEFEDDVEYIMDGLQETQPVGTRCLSTLSLASKCLVPAFRMHMRAHGIMSKVFKALQDAPDFESLSLCLSAMLFTMSCDRLTIELDNFSLQLILRLLDIAFDGSDSERSKATTIHAFPTLDEIERIKQKVFDVCSAAVKLSKIPHQDLKAEDITTYYLAMQSLLSLSLRQRQTADWFKESIRSLGGLNHIINTASLFTDGLEKAQDCSSRLVLYAGAEKCLKVLDNVTYMCLDNQLFLIDFQLSQFISSLQRLLRISLEDLSGEMISTEQISQNDSKTNIGKDHPHYITSSCMLALFRLLLNITQENEHGIIVTGQQESLMLRVLTTALSSSRFIVLAHQFDLSVLSLCLLINLVEKNEANRQTLIRLKVLSPSCLESEDKTVSSLEALGMLFSERFEAARMIEDAHDTDMDAAEKQQKLMENPSSRSESQLNGTNTEMDESGQWFESESGLEWIARDDSEFMPDTKVPVRRRGCEETPVASQEDNDNYTKELHAAGRHMEECIIAAYVALLIGSIIQHDRHLAERVRESLPEFSFAPLVRMVRKFLGFMSIANMAVGSGSQSFQGILEVLEMC